MLPSRWSKLQAFSRFIKAKVVFFAPKFLSREEVDLVIPPSRLDEVGFREFYR